MQLLYVYIGGYEHVDKNSSFAEHEDSAYKVFKNVEFNLSNRFIFERTVENELKVKLNDQHVENFFDRRDVVNSITAVIGKNGSGKSSFIDLLKRSKADNITNIPYKMIYIFGDISSDEGVRQKFRVIQNEKLEINYSFTHKKIEYSFYKQGDYRDLEILLKTPHIIYYSPILNFDFSNVRAMYELDSSTGITDISTSHLVLEDAKSSRNSDTQTKNAVETLVRHKVMETQRQYTFAKEAKDILSELKIKSPNYIEFVVDTNDQRELSQIEREYVKGITEYFNIIKKKGIHLGKEDFIFETFKAAYFNFIRYANFMTNASFSHKTFEDFDKFKFNDIENETIINIIQKSLKFKFEKRHTTVFEHFNLIWEARIKFILALFSLDEDDFKPIGNNPNCILDFFKHNEIIKQYFDAFQITGFLLTNWKIDRVTNGALSSGEQMRFALFSRLYDAFLKINDISPRPKDILLLMDEAETSYHPEWQRTFLFDLIRFLKTLYVNMETVQIILSTHSPFISSDLPWYSIIKLDKDEVKGLTKVEYDETKTTFATNIHDLFKDSFYMENGFVGEFAKEKIKSLFERIKQPSKDSILELEKEIKLIGEPFIQMSLLETLKENTTNE